MNKKRSRRSEPKKINNCNGEIPCPGTEAPSEEHDQDGRPSTGKDPADTQPRLFSVFTRKNKIVHLIRHGHTTYHEGRFRTRKGNHPFDVILSPLGIEQASALKVKLSSLGAEVILVSPLMRALQTLQHAVGFTETMHSGHIEVSHLHTEHVQTSVDVGTPASMLAEEFPMLSFAGLPEVWWYSPPNCPNDPISGVFNSPESIGHLRKRVGRFRQHLLSRPESVLIVIGHSTFFKELLGSRKRMKNCEIKTLRL